MAFSTNCTNKGCYKQMNPYLDPKDNKVYCSECDCEIQNITDFAKRSMKSSKQFRVDKKNSFSVVCNHCKNNDRPFVQNKKLHCNRCKKEITNVTSFYTQMFIERLREVDKD